jgi:hypothetical protein
MNSEESWGSPGADFRGNIDILSVAAFAVAKIRRLDAYRAPYHSAWSAR